MEQFFWWFAFAAALVAVVPVFFVRGLSARGASGRSRGVTEPAETDPALKGADAELSDDEAHSVNASYGSFGSLPPPIPQFPSINSIHS